MKKIISGLLVLLALLLPAVSRADGREGGAAGVWTVRAENGEVLCTLADEAHVGDEYISGDNRRYEILSADAAAHTAVARDRGAQEMPDVSWLAEETAIVVSNTGETEKKDLLIAMYSTHSDESYEPTDGTASDEKGEGGIYDVDAALKEALEARGVRVILDETPHVPHDSSAYKRSRQTALELLKKSPDALLDIHRDGIPDPDEYETELQGEDVSRVRLLVGRSNQNAAENRQFALQLKAVADQQYPGLIKDIFIGKGTYNQDLAPNAILLEFGTHTIDKERAVASTQLMANVLADTLYGDISGADERAVDGRVDLRGDGEHHENKPLAQQAAQARAAVDIARDGLRAAAHRRDDQSGNIVHRHHGDEQAQRVVPAAQQAQRPLAEIAQKA